MIRIQVNLHVTLNINPAMVLHQALFLPPLSKFPLGKPIISRPIGVDDDDIVHFLMGFEKLQVQLNSQLQIPCHYGHLVIMDSGCGPQHLHSLLNSPLNNGTLLKQTLSVIFMISVQALLEFDCSLLS